MNKKIFSFFILIFLILTIYNFVIGSDWLFDNILTIILLILVFYFNKKLKLNNLSYVMLNIALLSHNLGTFGFYSLSLGIISYDDAVHFLSSLVGAWIIFNFVTSFHLKFIQAAVKENRTLLIILVIAFAIFFGTLVEILEFAGFSYFGPGEGILFTGAGDYGKFGDPATQYNDTMTDIIVNVIGSTVGALFFYVTHRKKKYF